MPNHLHQPGALGAEVDVKFDEGQAVLHPVSMSPATRSLQGCQAGEDRNEGSMQICIFLGVEVIDLACACDPLVGTGHKVPISLQGSAGVFNEYQ